MRPWLGGLVWGRKQSKSRIANKLQVEIKWHFECHALLYDVVFPQDRTMKLDYAINSNSWDKESGVMKSSFTNCTFE